MKKFAIYYPVKPEGQEDKPHPMGGYFFDTFKDDDVKYEKVAIVEASNIVHVFPRIQNFNEEYSKNGVRSGSVGDIVLDIEDDTAYFVAGDGYTQFGINNFNARTHE